MKEYSKPVFTKTSYVATHSISTDVEAACLLLDIILKCDQKPVYLKARCGMDVS